MTNDPSSMHDPIHGVNGSDFDEPIAPQIPNDDPTTQTMREWLKTSSSVRASRRFLENHLALLHPRTIAFLNTVFLRQHGNTQAEEQVRDWQYIIQAAIANGSTATAVHDAYVDARGGFALDLPVWLEQEIEVIEMLNHDGDHERLAFERGHRWKAAYEQASSEHLAPAILGEIAEKTAISFQQVVSNQYVDAQEWAIDWHIRATAGYREEHYPRQWAMIQNNLGIVYRDRIRGGKAENQSQAIACYTAALRIYREDYLPVQWAMTQNNLGIVYDEQVQGDKSRNQEYAIACFSTALPIFNEDRYPIEHAGTQHNLGVTYRNRIQGNKAENQEFAIACYVVALRIYTETHLPLDWAMTQHNLGNVYGDRIQGNKIENQEFAITCFSAALRVYTEAHLPTQWAGTQNSLGMIYRERIQGDKAENQECAIAYYAAAMRVFTEDRLPREWAMAQNNLGMVYHERIRGNKAENQERAIACYFAALQVRNAVSLPEQWAMTQQNLGAVYHDRIQGGKAENQERALTFYTAALQIFTEAHRPEQWATIQHNLGTVYRDRIQGDKAENQEYAIACYTAALRIFTEDLIPLDWAMTQSNLGVVYRVRLQGDKAENQKHAIACFSSTLRIFTRDLIPLNWAKVQHNLGNVYQERIQGDKVENQEQTIGYFSAALQVYTEDRLPTDHRVTARSLAAYLCALGRWEEAQSYYASARRAETLLLAFAATAHNQDLLLNDGREATTREAYALTQLGRNEAAIRVLEQGRARTLAAARAQAAANPMDIRDSQQRERYIAARDALQSAQQAAYMSLDPHLDEHQRRIIILKQNEAISKAYEDFNDSLKDIALAQDATGFMQLGITDEMLLDILEYCPQQHGLVYLLATPWGGCGLAVYQATSAGKATIHVSSCALPLLTKQVVSDLLEADISDGSRSLIIGGLSWGQMGRAFDRFRHLDWRGATFRQRAEAMQAECHRTGSQSSFVTAAQAIMDDRNFAQMIEIAFVTLEQNNRKALGELAEKFNHVVLSSEIQRALTILGKVAMHPLAENLRDQGMMGVTLIPCGALAAFPLLASSIPVNQALRTSDEWSTFADGFPHGVSIAPSARALLRANKVHRQRAGLRAIGNPAEAGGNPLRWGQAEAMTLAYLAGEGGEVHTRFGATRTNVVKGLGSAWIYEASCHGNGGDGDFLDYGLFLARGERLTLRDIFTGDVANLQGLRLFILSACQTGIIDLRGAHDEVRSLAVGLLQAGCEAVLATQWSVDEYSTYLLIVRFFQLWQQSEFADPPALALTRAQAWLRMLTWADLLLWQGTTPMTDVNHHITETTSVQDNSVSVGMKHDDVPDSTLVEGEDQATYEILSHNKGLQPNMTPELAQAEVRSHAQKGIPNERPFTDPFYWAGFSLNGW